MKVLVAGASGFIGTHLCRLLDQLGADVTPIDLVDCDVRDTEGLRSIIARVRPETVYHLAAVASVTESWARPSETWSTNVLGTAAVLEATRLAAPTARVLVMSTASVYDGAALDGPVDESRPVQPLSPYGTSKAMAETLARHYSAAYGMPVLVVRPTNVIGPGQHSSYVVPALSRRILGARAAGLSSITIGNWDAERDFVDVRDAVVALTRIAQLGAPGGTYNICTGVGTTIADLARQLCALAGTELSVLPDPALQRRIDARSLVGDPTRINREIGWQARRPLTRTLSDVLAMTAATGDESQSGGAKALQLDVRK
ncbi:GDP-mannose 4,6-dehydratase [Micromonospora sp. NPDC050495]|uniref:GDP-mannose 4,6-dehydratase n=1 Tax=Micromonospora sp. NPDC050495 TaxID=3154936 RepID=UPI003400F691